MVCSSCKSYFPTPSIYARADEQNRPGHGSYPADGKDPDKARVNKEKNSLRTLRHEPGKPSTRQQTGRWKYSSDWLYWHFVGAQRSPCLNTGNNFDGSFYPGG